MKTITIDGIEYELKEITKQQKEIQEQQKTKEERFAELISGIDISSIDISSPETDFEKYPNTLFWFDKDGNYICDYNFETKEFGFNYFKVCSVFEDEFSMGSNEIEDFAKIQVEKYFKTKGVTTGAAMSMDPGGVEKYFKTKGVTTDHIFELDRLAVENHFKLNVDTSCGD